MLGLDERLMEPTNPPKDNRCTYRIRKKWNKRQEQYRYYPEYKKPNGWLWYSIWYKYTSGEEVDSWWKESLAKAECERHATKHMKELNRLAALPANRTTSFINLGKLP